MIHQENVQGWLIFLAFLFAHAELIKCEALELPIQTEETKIAHLLVSSKEVSADLFPSARNYINIKKDWCQAKLSASIPLYDGKSCPAGQKLAYGFPVFANEKKHVLLRTFGPSVSGKRSHQITLAYYLLNNGIIW